MSKQEDWSENTKNDTTNPNNLSSEQNSNATVEPQESNTTGRVEEQGVRKKDSSLRSRIETSTATLFRDALSLPGGEAGIPSHFLGAGLAESFAGTGKAGATAILGAGSSSASASATQAARLRNTEGVGSASFVDEPGSYPGSGSRSTIGSISLGSTLRTEHANMRSKLIGGFQLDAIGVEQFSHQHGSSLDGDYCVNQDQTVFANSDPSLSEEAAAVSPLNNKQESIGKGKSRARESESPLHLNVQHEDHRDLSLSSSLSPSRSIPPARQPPQAVPPHPNNNASDGAAVVSLLSDPSFQPGYVTKDGGYQSFVDELTANNPDAPPLPLTAEEIRIIDSFRRRLHSSPSDTYRDDDHHRENSLVTSTSLIPDIDPYLAQGQHFDHLDRRLGRSNGNYSGSYYLHDFILANLEDGDAITAEWLRVQERYHDDVWGYLQPELDAATRELKRRRQNLCTNGTEGREGSRTREGPAVRRLRMILGHMQG
jgi:hypothetical protein